MKRRPGVAATAGVLALALTLGVAACGGNGGGKSAADRERDAWEAALNYAQCMREHGVDVSDPTRDSGGGITQRGPVVGPNGVSEAKVREAEQACRKYQDGEPAELSEEEQREFRDAALAFARCMREHGIENYPDPTIGEGGRVEQQIDQGSGLNPKSEEFREAEEACRDEMPGAPDQGVSP